MYTPSRRLLAATAAFASALFLAGCADDDDPIATPSEPVASQSATPSATPSIDDLCDAKVAVDAAFLAGGPPEESDATPTPEQIGEGIKASFSDSYADLKEAAAGSEVEGDVDKLVSGLDAAIDAGDDEFFFKPDFVAADNAVDDLPHRRVRVQEDLRHRRRLRVHRPAHGQPGGRHGAHSHQRGR